MMHLLITCWFALHAFMQGSPLQGAAEARGPGARGKEK